MAVIPSNAHKFIDDRHSEDRRLRRTSWFGSKVLAIPTPFGLSGGNGNLAPKREDVIRVLNSPAPNSHELSTMTNKFFAMLDALVLKGFRDKEIPKDQMIARSFSVILAPDYVIHCSGDNSSKQNYVSVLAGNKVLNIRDANNFELTDKKEKTQIFLSLEDKGQEAEIIRSNLMTLDTLVAVEKLDGERLRLELPELNTVVKNIAKSYGGSVDIIESEISYLSVSRNELQNFDLSLNTSAAPDKVAQVRIDDDSLENLISKAKLCKGRVRLNLNSQSELETVDVLCKAIDTETKMKKPGSCLVILMND